MSSPIVAAEGPRPSRRRWLADALPWALILALGLLHAWGTVASFGGFEQLVDEWPLGLHDHPVHFNSLVVGPLFLRQSGTNAGYDPGFMAGYPKSVIFPQSSTLFDVVGLLTSGASPPRVYKLTVFLAVALLPAWLGLAGRLLGMGAWSLAWSLALLLIYTWGNGGGANYPLNYAFYGMTTYLVAVPLSIAAVAALARALGRGGLGWWAASAGLMALALLLHVSSPLILGPAGLLAYGVAIRGARLEGRRLGRSRHLGFWLVPASALAVNAFWWWPGLLLLEMLGDSKAAFTHSDELIHDRLAQIVTIGPSIQSFLLALLVPGLVVLGRRDRLAAAALAGVALAGFGWGYLAGALPELDQIQPGRQTYALHAAAILAAGLALTEIGRIVREGFGGWRLDLWLAAGLILVGIRAFGPDMETGIRSRVGDPARRIAPSLSSRPTPRFLWILERLREGVRPGERVLYEEGGLEVEGQPDPYQGHRYSGLLPYMTGVEVLGGPYLKSAVKTNFTQFGGGILFGRDDWDQAHFRRYAEIYRPSAIVCWSPRAIAFVRSHPELFEDGEVDKRWLPALDPASGRVGGLWSELVFARIKGFGGPTVKGRATVTAEPGRIRVEGAVGDELDGLVVLRYHSVPYLRADPPTRLETVQLGDDPVPFIGFRPPPGEFTLELDFPP